MTEAENNTFILAGNGPYLNRGCEAIVRGTARILRASFDSPEMVVCSRFGPGGLSKQKDIEKDPNIAHEQTSNCKRFDKDWFITNAMKRVYPPYTKRWYYKSIMPHLVHAKAVLAVGGDNYSLEYGKRPLDLCTALDDVVLEAKKKMVIWGASVGPFSEDRACEKYMIEHFRNIHIFARESLTYDYLRNKGLIDTVHRVADPAFLLEPVKPNEDKFGGIIPDGSIGVNFSPLMAKFAGCATEKEWGALCVKIIEAILLKTNREVYLIPHVSGSFTGQHDHAFLSRVASCLDRKETMVKLVPDTLNAAESKWLISQMALFAGARTHATIAALSSCVPTLSFGYSVKSRGINLDIYGHTDHCLHVADLTPAVVASKMMDMLNHAGSLRKSLSENIPKMTDLALGAGTILKNILES